MNTAIWILMVQASLGTFDTLYYHEYKLKLPSGDHSSHELRLHALRDFLYAIIIGSLAWVTWNGPFAASQPIQGCGFGGFRPQGFTLGFAGLTPSAWHSCEKG